MILIGGVVLKMDRLQAKGRPLWAWELIRVSVSLLLLTTAALKGYALATGPVSGEGLLESRWLLILVVEGELLLGLWLLSGLWSRTAWGAALLCFSGFAAVSLYKGLLGESSCGCFGRVEVSPWWMLGLDVLVVATLILVRPSGRTILAPPLARRRLAVVAAMVLLAGMPAGWMMASYRPVSLDSPDRMVRSGELVVLEPANWLDKQFPLLEHIDVNQQLAEGQWLVVLYRHDCAHCVEMLPVYERQAQNWSEGQSPSRVALVEMPPYAPPGRSPVNVKAPTLRGRLNTTFEWFVQTPVELQLTDGAVLQAIEGAGMHETTLDVR